MFEKFTERARRVMGHSLLLAMLDEGGPLAEYLVKRGVDTEAVRSFMK